ncbi:hypothetical protein SOVF_175240 [Spinacia oleracea]|nr:hypothetical protein SOVF_175240 [Spinacia oleracea]
MDTNLVHGEIGIGGVAGFTTIQRGIIHIRTEPLCVSKSESMVVSKITEALMQRAKLSDDFMSSTTTFKVA